MGAGSAPITSGGIPWLGQAVGQGGSELTAVLCSPLGCSRAPCCLHELGILLGLHLPPLLSLAFSPVSLPFLVCITQISFPPFEFIFSFFYHHSHGRFCMLLLPVSFVFSPLFPS